jgi:hypothetical protein
MVPIHYAGNVLTFPAASLGLVPVAVPLLHDSDPDEGEDETGETPDEQAEPEPDEPTHYICAL